MNSPPETDQRSPVHVLWTSGWDSTFRVLDALFNQKRSVQPHYLVDPGRPSAKTELSTIDTLRAAIEPRLPDAASLLPTQVTRRPDIAEHPQITEAWQRLAKQAPLGEQYEWIARYAEMQNLKSLELSVHVDDRAYLFLDKKIHQIDDAGTVNYALAHEADADTALVFGRLRFPLLHISKVEMQHRSDTSGFRDIMELTWFCHNPKGGKPCGMCYPCKFALDEGMARRLPPLRRLKARLVWSGPGQKLRTAARKTLRRA
jgi:hypothetical protein